MADRRERALDRVRRAQVLSARQGSRRRQAALRDPSSVLADNGAVLAICAHTQSNVEERAEELRQAGARVLAVAASLTDEAQVRQLIERVLSEYTKIDILVNLAGGLIPTFEKFDSEGIPARAAV